MPPIIGIDLGTTNSCAAVASTENDVALIPYRAGDFTVPSIYAISDKGAELVGYEAQRQWQLNPKNTIYGSKRLVGLTIQDDMVERIRKRVSYELVAGEHGEIGISVADKVLSLDEVAAKILSKIREVASNHLREDVSQAVVTVPAYYNDRQRQSVRRAGAIAGLEVVRMINEPTAAALAYGARRNVSQKLAVYDLGGGTFDMSVIEVDDNDFRVLATGGDIFLGGIDFDNALVRFVLSEFSAKEGKDLSSDPVAMQRIRDMAEQVKIDLSARNEVPMSIPFISMSDSGTALDLNMVLHREELESLVEPVIEQTFETCARVIQDSGLTVDQLDQILLVGGQTRMPLVQERITKFFGKEPSKGVHPDEAVAVGAALYARSLSDVGEENYTLRDVLPMGIGIQTATGAIQTLFERNTPVPQNKTFKFTTHKDDQRDLVMRIVQGDAPRARDNTLLGEFTFSGIRPGEAGSVKVDVTFDISPEGILSLDAKDRETGTIMQKTVRLE